jgi:hypothetical protein
LHALSNGFSKIKFLKSKNFLGLPKISLTSF